MNLKRFYTFYFVIAIIVASDLAFILLYGLSFGYPEFFLDSYKNTRIKYAELGFSFIMTVILTKTLAKIINLRYIDFYKFILLNLLIAVVLISLLGLERLRQRKCYCIERAVYHRLFADIHGGSPGYIHTDKMQVDEGLAKFHRALESKWSYLADHPWNRFDPGPPEQPH